MYNLKLRPNKELILCEDGTNTLFSEEFNEPYHSTKDGALHESLEKYVKPSLSIKKDKSSLKILDICFGLGYNVFATIYYIKQHNLKTKIEIISSEFDEELIKSLKNFSYPPEFLEIKHIINALSEFYYYEDEQFKIEIIIGDARETIPKLNTKVDIIYQDAFSPSSNPLLWTTEWFKVLKEYSFPDTILLTYSTAISTRMGLYENGFYIFVHYAKLIRYSTIASVEMLKDIEYIDMELKQKRNTEARSLKDKSFKS